MRLVRIWTLLLGLAAIPLSGAEQDTKAKIYKVLPHYLDQEGRHALSPSLFDRDAYQAYLKKNPDLCSAVRFDIQWKATGDNSETLELFAEVRTKNSDPAKSLVLRKEVRDKNRFRQWASILLTGETFKTAGEITAWRITLWDGDTFLAQQKSFLW